MLRVLTDRRVEKDQLSQQYSRQDGAFLVPSGHSQLLVQMLRSIQYQYFRQNCPVISSMISQMLIKIINFQFSLKDYRELVAHIKKTKQLESFYSDHYRLMSAAFDGEQEGLCTIQERQQEVYSSDGEDLFAQTQLGQEHLAFFIQTTRLLPSPLSQEECKQEKQSQQTQIASTITSYKQEPVTQFKKLSCFLTQSAGPFCHHDRIKEDSFSRESSKGVTSFVRKRQTIITAPSNMANLLKTQEKYEIKRQKQLYKASYGLQEIAHGNYSKMIRGQLIKSKLKYRKKL